MESENHLLIRGWIYIFLGAILVSIGIASGLWFTTLIWSVILLMGVLDLVMAFVRYQWPHWDEYKQYWRDMIAMHMPAKRGK